MTKKVDLPQTIGILANLGVVAGIVFLAIEINQNQQVIEEQNALHRAAARDAAGEAWNGFRQLLLENTYLIPVWERGVAGAQLTPEEESQFRYLCEFRLWGQINLYVRMEALQLWREAEAIVGGIAGQAEGSDALGRCWDGLKGAVSERGYEHVVERVDSVRERY